MTKIIPDIAVKFPSKFQNDFPNTMQYFGFFTKEEIENNKDKLLMLDIDFGRYCSLSCPACFRKSNLVDDIPEGDLTYDELIKIIDEAKVLGLKMIKICGAGEPTQNSRFLPFIEAMTKKDIGVAVFTKGQVLGSDEQAKKFNQQYGINSAKELCQRLAKLKVSFMLSFQSFEVEKQDELVGGIKGHALIRNQALVNLVEAGFNNSEPTRLCLELGPITKKNYEEVFAIYTYARRRNIYLITNLLMTSGKQIDSDFLAEYDFSPEAKIDLFTKIYSWNIENGLQTLDQIKEEGISCMPGIHPCNQVACGLYITAKGNAVGCPGFGELEDIEGNIRKEDIKTIWEKSRNKKLYVGKFNCLCPPKDGITIPYGLYAEVLKRLEKRYNNKH
ncbi:MAG: radical SAM protein [Patescibacteria group bacterium]|jgi:MoaA/NifB/PqqE/SkfB family radical SAM enzyme